MRIPTSQPRKFAAGDLLAPEDLNAVFLDAADALDEGTEHRFVHGILPLQFTGGPAAPYTDATLANVRTVRFTCPQTCIIERAVLSADMTCNGAVDVNIVAAGGGTPSGAPVPWLSTGIGSIAAGTVFSATSPDRVFLVAGTEYVVSVTAVSPIVFSLGRFDLDLHVLVDRFGIGATVAMPLFTPTLLSDFNPPSAVPVAANISALASAASLLAASNNAVQPVIFQMTPFLSTTPQSSRTFRLPRCVSSRAKGNIVALYMRVEMGSTGGAAQTISGAIQSSAGVPLLTVAVPVAGVTAGNGVSNSDTTTTVIFATGGVSADNAANDLRFQFSNSSNAVAPAKCTALLWVSR